MGDAGRLSRLLTDLPSLDYFDPAYQEDPHRFNAAALAQGPIASGPLGPELLGYELVQKVLRDPGFRMPIGLGLEVQGVTSGPLWDRTVSGIMSLDGAEHQRLRRLVSRSFTPRAADRLRDKMVEVINGLIDPVAPAGRCDVVTDVAGPYPIPVICELLGAPRDDWQRFSAWTDEIFKIFNFDLANDEADIMRAFEELDAYIGAMVEERRLALSEDLVSELIRAEDEGDRLSGDELKMLVSAILNAGTDTTRSQLAAAAQVFCAHPEQWKRLAEQPELGPRVVDEVTRHSPVVFRTMRVATKDVDLDGLHVSAGTLVGANTAAANRDPAVFDDPDRFDITRDGPAPTLTFGGGIHYCLGVHLAKAELSEALAAMARRMPNLRLVGPAPWKPLFGVSGPLTLPVEFDAGH